MEIICCGPKSEYGCLFFDSLIQSYARNGNRFVDSQRNLGELIGEVFELWDRFVRPKTLSLIRNHRLQSAD